MLLIGLTRGEFVFTVCLMAMVDGGRRGEAVGLLNEVGISRIFG